MKKEDADKLYNEWRAIIDDLACSDQVDTSLCSHKRYVAMDIGIKYQRLTGQHVACHEI